MRRVVVLADVADDLEAAKRFYDSMSHPVSFPTQDARRMSLLFQFGIVPADELLAWADSLVVQMDSPPHSLLELSTTAPSNTADLLSSLLRLGSGADFWTALRSALPRIRDYVVSHPDSAESIANHLFLTINSFSVSDVPDDLRFLYRFDDAFTLAREGTYGDLKTVYREFVHDLDKSSPVT